MTGFNLKKKINIVIQYIKVYKKKQHYILKIDLLLSFLEKVAVLPLGKGELYVF